MDCLFCKIIKGEIPSRTLYEDEMVKVIMDINPHSNGHCLVIPKKHATDFEELDDKTLGYINKVAKQIKKGLYESLKPAGLILVVNYGKPQLIKHYHLHLVPVYEPEQPIDDVEKIFEQIKKVM